MGEVYRGYGVRGYSDRGIWGGHIDMDTKIHSKYIDIHRYRWI